MFISFFYHLREAGLPVSLQEWLALTEALDRGLCAPSLLEFYHLCRSVLVKSEGDYDKFDMAFAAYFDGIGTSGEIPEEVWGWLNGKGKTKEELRDRMDPMNTADYDLEKLRDMLKERLEEQKSRHAGGSYWIGTGGTSVLGHSGYADVGVRVGGESRYKNALQVARQRDYRDFREDNIIDPRQFQLAFRRLRQFSTRIEGPKTELDIDATVRKTCDAGGNLRLVFDHPRKNTIKLLLLFDAGGSMLSYSRLCSALFQAVDKSNHFKDLKVYYFHNCVYEHLYKTPRCRRGDWVDTDWVLKNYGSEYRVVFVGDASMSDDELLRKGGCCLVGLYNEIPGIQWLHRIRDRYSHQIWLNPIEDTLWDFVFGSHSIKLVRQVFPMYELSVKGLETGIRKLLVSR
ncbi:MAG: VWA domain-containing protein [Bacillota bacterium]|nr:VWA domain-containing protein [Bacillota bacterium]